ncbi:MAG: HopJ type III effector protein [Reinekea sp.]
MTLSSLLEAIYQNSSELKFTDVLDVIDSEFEFTPTPFTNGPLNNSADQNQGSCKILSFANQAGLSERQTLQLFAEHYRAVLANPEGEEHTNIRQFMKTGWRGVSFASKPLQKLV